MYTITRGCRDFVPFACARILFIADLTSAAAGQQRSSHRIAALRAPATRATRLAYRSAGANTIAFGSDVNSTIEILFKPTLREMLVSSARGF